MKELVLDFTRRCNSKCTTCNIWQEQGPELSLHAIEKVLRSDWCKELLSVYVTGGEPYLSNDILGIAQLIAETDAMMTGATNGLMPEQILQRALACYSILEGNYAVDVSINGRPMTHDETRGIQGAWEKAVKTLRLLRDSGIHTNIAYLATPETIKDWKWIHWFAREERVGLGITWARGGKRFGAEGRLDWHQFDQEQYEQLPSRFPCPGIKRMLVIDPWGNVWPCEEYLSWHWLGNVHRQSLDDIMGNSGLVAERIGRGECQPYSLAGLCHQDCWVRKVRNAIPQEGE